MRRPATADEVGVVCWGVDPIANGYRVHSYDVDGDWIAAHTPNRGVSRRDAFRCARKLARALGVPCRESGRQPEIWVKSAHRWVAC